MALRLTYHDLAHLSRSIAKLVGMLTRRVISEDECAENIVDCLVGAADELWAPALQQISDSELQLVFDYVSRVITDDYSPPLWFKVGNSPENSEEVVRPLLKRRYLAIRDLVLEVAAQRATSPQSH